MRGFPWWPALAVATSDVPESLRGKKEKARGAYLKYFGTHDFNFHKADSVKLLHSDSAKAELKNGKIRSALSDLLDYCKIHALPEVATFVRQHAQSIDSDSSDDDGPLSTLASASNSLPKPRTPSALPPATSLPSLEKKKARSDELEWEQLPGGESSASNYSSDESDYEQLSKSSESETREELVTELRSIDATVPEPREVESLVLDTFLELHEAFTNGEFPQDERDEPLELVYDYIKKLSEGKRSRKRHRNETGWKRNVERSAKIAKKGPKAINCDTCFFKCSTKVSNEARETICETFWGLSFERQREMIIRFVRKNQIERRRARKENAKERQAAFGYYFPCYQETCEKCPHRVCKTFFVKTLDVSTKKVRNAILSTTPQGTCGVPDSRGRHTPSYALSEATAQLARDHIESFPVMPSHYCRASTKVNYLASDLTIFHMHRLYLEAHPEPENKIGYEGYRRIFENEFNLSFFKPKKDLCLKCEKWKNIQDPAEADEYNREVRLPHRVLKQRAQDLKAAHRLASRNWAKPWFTSASFDLQSVLYTPKSEVSPFYYSRKLCIYNFTVLEQRNMNGHCFLWGEYDGKRGAAEIGTCLLEFLRSLPPTISDVSLFSDSCPGQNRNGLIAAVLHFGVQTIENLEKVTLTFLERGHTEMEVDSMHARIENVSEHKEIYTYREWATLIQNARHLSHRPYILHHMQYSSFHDLAHLSASTLGSPRPSIQWRNVRQLQAQKSMESSMRVNYSYEEEQFVAVSFHPRRVQGPQLIPLYSKKMPVSQQKKADLMKLLKDGAIPSECRAFYEDLQTAEMADAPPLSSSESSDAES